MKKKLDDIYRKDGIDVFHDFWVGCITFVFKMMAFCLLGVMLLTGIKEGWQKITGTKATVAQPVKAAKTPHSKIINPIKQTKEAP